MNSGKFNLWVFGDVHVGSDLKRGRESLADALRVSEQGGDQGGPSFEWDIAVDVGDMSGGQTVPEDEEGEEIVRQFGVLQEHHREAIYNLCGNHDRSGLDEPAAWWWQKWIDPMGENTPYSHVDPAKRPFPIEGTWERYSFRVGNLLFLVMSDINEPSQKIGRGDLGGNPAGVVSGETFLWWKNMVESNPESIIISAHHYMPKDTTVASGEWEGMRRDEAGDWQGHYHGYKPQGAPAGASYLYFVDSKPDAQAFEQYMSEHPGAVDIWLGGHTHAHPDDTCGGKSHIETKWGTHFINAACLSRFHGTTNVPKSRLLTFAEGSNEIRVQCYMHTDEFLPQGWYDQAERGLKLSRVFQKV
jgi:Calcineurin-like phosphoesterase